MLLKKPETIITLTEIQTPGSCFKETYSQNIFMTNPMFAAERLKTKYYLTSFYTDDIKVARSLAVDSNISASLFCLPKYSFNKHT